MTQVAALFVDPRGPYPALLGAENCWDESRDAKCFNGSCPVICHPPCQLWTNITGVNYKRYGGSHNRPGNDNGCFFSALKFVRRNGGIIEHPAGSYAWNTFDLTRPHPALGLGEWAFVGNNEWICEVWQSAYGHKAQKATWLIYVGKNEPRDMLSARVAGTHQCGWFDRIKPTLGKREASLTPVLFAQALIQLAANCGGAP